MSDTPETESAPAEAGAAQAGPDAEVGASTGAVPSPAVDLANRPDAEWLTGIDVELDDVDLVLKCLARDSATICKTCDQATAEGWLADRPVLARCASTKQPRD